jgi:GAF domain-containing protein
MGEDRNGQRRSRGRPSKDYTGTEARRSVLAEKFGELARSMQGEKGVEQTLDAIVRAAAETVPGAEEASISAVIARREVRTPAATGELPRAVDRAQYETCQGPCLDSLYHQQSLRLPDIRSEPRWPDFSARATELGVRSMLAVQLYVDGQDLGALNLHSRQVDAFTDESEEIALIFASHAAVAFAGAKTQDQLETAIDRRDLIGQAKGVLIERYKISGQEAFRLLVVTSQTTNIKLFDVAEYLVRTGELASLGKRGRSSGEDPQAATQPAEG